MLTDTCFASSTIPYKVSSVLGSEGIEFLQERSCIRPDVLRWESGWLCFTSAFTRPRSYSDDVPPLQIKRHKMNLSKMSRFIKLCLCHFQLCSVCFSSQYPPASSSSVSASRTWHSGIIHYGRASSNHWSARKFPGVTSLLFQACEGFVARNHTCACVRIFHLWCEHLLSIRLSPGLPWNTIMEVQKM